MILLEGVCVFAEFLREFLEHGSVNSFRVPCVSCILLGGAGRK